jgi:hypothetical protein
VLNSYRWFLFLQRSNSSAELSWNTSTNNYLLAFSFYFSLVLNVNTKHFLNVARPLRFQAHLLLLIRVIVYLLLYVSWIIFQPLIFPTNLYIYGTLFSITSTYSHLHVFGSKFMLCIYSYKKSNKIWPSC